MKPFSAEAEAACRPHGHTWRWVRSWHRIGFWECAVCWVTRALQEIDMGVEYEVAQVVRRKAAFAEVGDAVVEAPAAADPVAAPAAGRRPGAWAKLAERDTQLEAAIASGRPVAEIAAQYQLTATRIYQIRSRMRRLQAQAAT